MNKRRIKEEARLYFIPFILGDNAKAHKLSLKIFRKYGIVSLILDSKRGAANLWDFSSRFTRLTPSISDALTVTQLLDLARQTKYTLPLLIPCSDEYETLVKENSAELESEFVIMSADFSFSSSPFNKIPE